MDTDFAGNFDQINALVRQSDGKLVAAGRAVVTNDNFALARYNVDGSLDTSFGGGDGLVDTAFGAGVDQAFALVLQPDGKLVAAGRGAIPGGSTNFALARYMPDGSLDPSFGGDGKVDTDFAAGTDQAFALVLQPQPDGKLVAAGPRAASGGTDNFALARYMPDGSLDTSFDGDGKVDTDFAAGTDQAFALVLQSDGKLVAAGRAFVQVVGGMGTTTNFGLARYNTDGSLDTSFDGDGKVDTDFTGGFDQAFALVLQPDGMLVAAGRAAVGTDNFALARYTADGILDSSFGVNGKLNTDFEGNSDQAFALVLQPDGKLVAAGRAFVGGNDDFALARYTADGMLDTSFGVGGKVHTDVTGTGVFDQANALVLQDDGKLVAAGVTGVGASSNFALARYHGISDTPTPTTATTTVTSSANPSVFGQLVSFDATVVGTAEPAPGGTVQFKVDGSDFGAPVTLVGGTATSGSISSLALGPHTIDAVYSGDVNYASSTGTLTQTVSKASTTTTVTSSANPSVFGQGVGFTATVAADAPGAGTPGGSVQFKVDGSNFGAPVTLMGGTATSGSTSSLAVGPHTIVVVYSGDASFLGSTGTLTQTVNKASTTTTVTSSANPVGLVGQVHVTFTATVSPVAPGGGTRTGTVQFKDGNANLGGPVTLNASGKASFKTSGSALGLGTSQITAVYSGSGNFNGSVSPVLNQKVVLVCLLVCI
ncbi:MAG: Ig-like domain repeat protein [Candidatus Rokuibacteriota bacterium]